MSTTKNELKTVSQYFKTLETKFQKRVCNELAWRKSAFQLKQKDTTSLSHVELETIKGIGWELVNDLCRKAKLCCGQLFLFSSQHIHIHLQRLRQFHKRSQRGVCLPGLQPSHRTMGNLRSISELTSAEILCYPQLLKARTEFNQEFIVGSRHISNFETAKLIRRELKKCFV